MSELADYKILALEEEVKKLREEVAANHDMIEQLKGAGLFLKICFVAAPTIGVGIVWAKNHIHF